MARPEFRSDPAAMTAAELSSAYSAGALSPVEATRAMLDGIAVRDEALNAFCLVDPERALMQAKESEARWHNGHPQGALDGVPMSIKDVFLTEDWPTLRGCTSIRADVPWPVDSPAAARLREDGLIFLGKTTTSELAWKATTDSALNGITRNPADPTKTTGGSSGGSAAAVAAGMGPVSIGTDGGGSVRIPASFCGVVGFKPTHGRISLYPASPFGPLAHGGPIARTVEDIALLMDILSVPDSRDPTSPAPPMTSFHSELRREVRGATAAYSPNLGFAEVDPEVAAIVETAVRNLGDSGLRVVDKDPGFADPRAAFERMWAAGAAALLAHFPENTHERVDPGLRAMWDRGLELSAVDYIQDRAVAAELGIRMGAFHAEHDVLITPTVPIPAFEAGYDVPPGSSMDSWPQWTPFTYPFNLTQQPAISIPAGVTGAGLPVGLQIVGQRHDDAFVLAVARFAEGVLA